MSVLFLETAFGYRTGEKDRVLLSFTKSSEDSDFTTWAGVIGAADVGLTTGSTKQDSGLQTV